MHPNSLANLEKGKATQFRTGDEQAKIARNGGVVSGFVRGSMKNIDEYIRIISKQKAKDQRVKKMLKDAGITNAEDQTHEAIIAARIVADSEKGNYKAIELYLKISGQYPKDEVTVNNVNEPQIVINFPDDGRGGYD